jgi:branched-chain amino acid transport system substrate-binding protein
MQHNKVSRMHHRPFRRGALALAAVTAASIVLAACGTAEGGDDGGESYTLGFIAPLSGAMAPLGTSMLDGLHLAIDAANAEGGVHGRQIAIEVEDNKGDPSSGVTAARALASKSIAVTGGIPAQLIDAEAPVFAREGVPYVVLGAGPAVLDPVQETLFMSDIPSSAQGQPMVEFAEQLLGRADFTAAIGPVDTPSGKEWGANVEELSAMSDFTITSSTPIPVTAADLSAQAQRLVAGSPDVILSQAPDVPLVPLVRKIRELGFDGPIVNFAQGSSSAPVIDLEDSDVYIFRTTAQYDPTSEQAGVKRFVELVDAADKAELAMSQTQFSQSYVLGIVLIAALEQCGADCTKEDLAASLNDLTVDTEGFVPTPLVLTEDNHQATRAGVFYHWDGNGVVPAGDATPMPASAYTLEASLEE